jgi:hypothetical protein
MARTGTYLVNHLTARLRKGAIGDNLADSQDALNLLLARNRTRSLDGSIAGLLIGTAKAKVKAANTVLALVNGTRVALTTAEYAFTATTHDLVANTQAYYIYSLAAAGTVTVTKGTAVAHGATPALPATPANEYLLGYVLIHAATAAIFDATTTELDALGVGGSIAYTNCLGWAPGTAGLVPAAVTTLDGVSVA